MISVSGACGSANLVRAHAKHIPKSAQAVVKANAQHGRREACCGVEAKVLVSLVRVTRWTSEGH